MTGAEFYALLQQKYDKAYSGYLDTTKANRLVKEAMFNLAESIYRGLSIQKEYDELWRMVIYDDSPSVTGTSGQPSGYFETQDLTEEYLHLFRIGFEFEKRIYPTFSSGTAYFSLPSHNLREGDLIRLKNGANDGTYPVTETKVGKFKIDHTMVGAVGDVFFVTKREASPHFSDRKKSVLGAPTEDDPKYMLSFDGFGNRIFLLYPAPAAVYVDYMTAPPHIIDCADNVVDIETFYTSKFLYRLAEECVKSFAEQTRDYNLKQSATQTIIDNP